MKNNRSQLLNEVFVIGARDVVRTIQKDLDELYEKRDNLESMISEKERDLEHYNRKIKELGGS